MTLRQLRRGGVLAWPPAWAASYGPGSTFPVRGKGALVSSRVRAEGGVAIEIEHQNHRHTGVLTWDGRPPARAVAAHLSTLVGQYIRAIGDLEIDAAENIREVARQRLTSGTLPRPRSPGGRLEDGRTPVPTVRIGQGGGGCGLCDGLIAVDEVFVEEVGVDDRVVRCHDDCHTAWQEAVQG